MLSCIITSNQEFWGEIDSYGITLCVKLYVGLYDH